MIKFGDDQNSNITAILSNTKTFGMFISKYGKSPSFMGKFAINGDFQ
jgi:hypothetical protein